MPRASGSEGHTHATPPHADAARPAFTLIELLVVIAIIAVLVSLTAVGVMKVRAVASTAPRTQYEISKLSDGLQTAMTTYGKTPGAAEQAGPVQPVQPLHVEPARRETATTPPCGSARPTRSARCSAAGCSRSAAIVIWDGSTRGGQLDTSVLEGHQCLVFYLGGPDRHARARPGLLRLLDRPAQPDGKSGGDPHRAVLRLQIDPAATSGATFFGYLDPYHDRSTRSPSRTPTSARRRAPNTYSPYCTSDCRPKRSATASRSVLWPYVDTRTSRTSTPTRSRSSPRARTGLRRRRRTSGDPRRSRFGLRPGGSGTTSDPRQLQPTSAARSSPRELTKGERSVIRKPSSRPRAGPASR